MYIVFLCIYMCICNACTCTYLILRYSFNRPLYSIQSPWTHKAATNPKQQWDSKDSSIKGSPLSGSLNQSISDDIELPIDRNYLQNHSDSPPAIKDEDLKYGRRIEVEINGNGDPGFSSTVV